MTGDLAPIGSDTMTEDNLSLGGSGGHRRAVLAVVAVMGVVGGLVAFLVFRDDESPLGTSATTSTETSALATTTSRVPATATTATTAPASPGDGTSTGPPSTPVDASTAVWPSESGPVYTSPVAAARGFAVGFVGFRQPVVGSFRQGDARSGEIDVRATADGFATTVLVCQLGGGGRWFVLGSITDNIQPSEPVPRTRVSSPLQVRGRSTAFEGDLSVEVRQDGKDTPIGTGIVTGGANGEMNPFDGTVTFERPTATAGAVLFLTHSADDGRVMEASTVRVNF